MKLETSPLPPIRTSPIEPKTESTIDVESPSCSTPSSAASYSGNQQAIIIGQSTTVEHRQMIPVTQETNNHLMDHEHCPVCGDRVSGYHCSLEISNFNTYLFRRIIDLRVSVWILLF